MQSLKQMFFWSLIVVSALGLSACGTLWLL